MKIVFLDAATMGDTPLAEIAELGELVCYDSSDAKEAIARVRDCEVLIINKVKVNAELIDAAPSLKLICEAATGTNNIDIAYATSKGIPVRNVAAYSTEAVVQATFMHILSLMGNAPYFDGRVKDGTYSASGMFTDLSKPFRELDGKRMGIIGLGAIGNRVAAVASAFGMHVSYYSTSGTSHSSDYPSISLDELMSESDVISIHAPLNDRTDGLVGSRELGLMKKDAIIVNMGRGGIVNEEALAATIDSASIAGAALDVYVKEPLAKDSPLLHTRHPELLRLTPHTAWASVEARQRLVHGIAENIKAALPFFA